MDERRALPVFGTTHWSVVLSAGDGTSRASREALERLCAAYWFPLYAYIRSKQFSPHDAEDLTQEFFALLLESGALRTVQEARGRFRSFLLACLNHFLANQWDRSRAKKRGGGAAPLSFDALGAEERQQLEPQCDSSLDPERLFDQRWARALLDRAFERLRLEMAAAGKATLFDSLRPQLSGAPASPYSELARDLGVSEPAVRKMVQRLRERCRELIREEVAHTVAAPHDVDSELRYLLTLFTS